MTERPQTLYIETVGCQMNVLDSEHVVAALHREGYELTDDWRRADLIIFNTCSVREHAEQKIYSRLGKLKRLKQRRPKTVIAVIGCMAQKDQQLIFERAPHVDLVVGTGQLSQLPQLVQKARETNRPQMAVSLDRRAGKRQEVAASFKRFDPLRTPEMRPNPFQAFVRVMFGCDKFCSYCVVPMTRGPEQCRLPSEVVQEVRVLADQGVKEVTLLGQTINSYKAEEGGRRFLLHDLLEMVHEVEGIVRIKFVTNYPKDMSDELLQAVRDLPKVYRYLHVPAQSGCNDVLKRMKRGYTVEQYLELIDRIHETIPECAVSSDFIVGFCGETEESFQRSMDLIARCRFKNSFIFKYSPRPKTKAVEWYEDDVPEEVKRRRNNEMLELQNAVSKEENSRWIGRTVEVLVEGPSKAAGKPSKSEAAEQLTGRTMQDRIVVFEGPAELAGELVQVRVEDCTSTTLIGSLVEKHAEDRPQTTQTSVSS